jgi:hypothetical protein
MVVVSGTYSFSEERSDGGHVHDYVMNSQTGGVVA